jgi:molybdopterin-containing oxidoreductase family membrane subunit
MVLILLIPVRLIYKLEEILTMRIFERVAQTIVFTGLIMGYSYATEFFIAWYSGNVPERDIFLWRATGPYAFWFWLMTAFNSVAPLGFFFKALRTRLIPLLVIAVMIQIGMWYERFVIILSSPAHEFDPYSWGRYFGPTWVEYGILIGSLSTFFLLFLLFAKFLPSVSMSELKEELPAPGRSRGEGRS